MSFSVFDTTNKEDFTKTKMFLGNGISVARYDRQKYPFLEKLTERQLSFFWLPHEVDCTKDARDFKVLTDHEKHIFTSNLKRQILLDSVQGRAPTAAFGPICSLPELENWIVTWAFSETIHSRSYTHIIRNVYANPSEIFDEMMDIEEIVACANDISNNYDELIRLTTEMNYGCNTSNMDAEDLYEIKRALWLCLMSVNILEGVRFYVSFACSWAFGESKRMEGNSKIIKLIARDENLHLAGTQQLLKVMPSDDSDFIAIRKETEDACIKMFVDAVNQEKAWAKYLFKDGSMIGLNEQLLSDYIEWIAHRRMLAVGLRSPYKGGSNPLPWTQKWIAGADVQVAPQESEIQTYTIGQIKMDMGDTSIKDWEL